MARVSTYLNFPRTTEEAFNFYKTVFGTEFLGPISRMGDLSSQEGAPSVVEADKNLVMHVALPILGGHIIMGTDASESMGFRLAVGNNMYLTLEPDSKEEADRLFEALSAGGKVEMPMQNAFWGDYYGSCRDKYGVGWMINYANKK